MARFDLHRNPNGPGYLLDVQSDFVSQLTTRIVIPLLPPDAVPRPIRDLHPAITVGGEDFVLVTPFLGAVTTRELGRPIGSLRDEADTITRALGILFTGF